MTASGYGRLTIPIKGANLGAYSDSSILAADLGGGSNEARRRYGVARELALVDVAARRCLFCPGCLVGSLLPRASDRVSWPIMGHRELLGLHVTLDATLQVDWPPVPKPNGASVPPPVLVIRQVRQGSWPQRLACRRYRQRATAKINVIPAADGYCYQYVMECIAVHSGKFEAEPSGEHGLLTWVGPLLSSQQVPTKVRIRSIRILSANAAWAMHPSGETFLLWHMYLAHTTACSAASSGNQAAFCAWPVKSQMAVPS